jgi:MFS family permease
VAPAAPPETVAGAARPYDARRVLNERVRTRLRLPHNVVVLSWVSFFQDAASELLYPVLPLFLVGPLGAPVAVVGIIEGIAEGTASIMKAVSGRLADRRARRPMIAAGYGLSSVAKLLIGAAFSWPLVLVARVIDRFGKGVRTSPRDALIAVETDDTNRGRAFGFHRAADTAGAVVGPLPGLALYEVLGHRIRPLFFVAFVPAAISVACIAFVREHPRPAAAGAAPASGPGAGALSSRYWRVVGFLTVFGLANFSDALLLLRAKALGLGFVGVIGAYVLYNLAYAALSFPAGVLSDRLPRRAVFAAGLVVFGVAYTGLGAVTTSTWVWVLLPFYGFYTALTDGVGKAWVAGLLPTTATGTGLGVYQGISGATAVVAGLWAGLLWHGTGRFPLVVSGCTVTVLAVVLVVAGARLERPDPPLAASPLVG